MFSDYSLISNRRRKLQVFIYTLFNIVYTQNTLGLCRDNDCHLDRFRCIGIKWPESFSVLYTELVDLNLFDTKVNVHIGMNLLIKNK